MPVIRALDWPPQDFFYMANGQTLACLNYLYLEFLLDAAKLNPIDTWPQAVLISHCSYSETPEPGPLLSSLHKTSGAEL